MKSLKDLMGMEDRVALITGGAGHIGQALCDALAEQGASIAIFDSDADGVEQTVDHLKKTYGVDAMGYTADLSRENQIIEAFDSFRKHYNRLDVLINCAALGGTAPLKGWNTDFLSQDIDTWRLAIEVNLTAAFKLSQLATPLLKASGHGAIINIASIYGLVGPDMGLYEGTEMGSPAAYAVSKGGLVQLTRWLSTTLAPEIRANTITPGGVWRGQPDAFVNKYKIRTPLKRMAVEEDFKGAIAYLASDLSAYVTGQNLIIDGGWTAW